uniref:Uncharacterized protein n=1 Tax=viral metagenome TaxID=1070528 RepID=A0A6M3JL00_9ZZZZ
MDKKVELRLNKLLDKVEMLKGELDDIVQEIEQTVLDAFDDGNDSGYKEGCEETEKKLAE